MLPSLCPSKLLKKTIHYYINVSKCEEPSRQQTKKCRSVEVKSLLITIKNHKNHESHKIFKIFKICKITLNFKDFEDFMAFMVFMVFNRD